MVPVNASENDERRPMQPHKMEAQVERWHNRGNVQDKIATVWADKEDWMSERKKHVHLLMRQNL